MCPGVVQFKHKEALMSACNNIFWAGLGAAAGFALALYIEQQVQEEAVIDDDDDGEGPNLRVVDDDDESSDG